MQTVSKEEAHGCEGQLAIYRCWHGKATKGYCVTTAGILAVYAHCQQFKVILHTTSSGPYSSLLCFMLVLLMH